MSTSNAKPRQAIWILLLGLGAAAAIVAWLALLLNRPSEVAQLLEILSGKDIPDAAWAFEKLKVVSDEELRELVEHVDDARETPLTSLWFSGSGVSGGTGMRSSPFAVGQIARFVIHFRTGDETLHASWDLDRPQPTTRAHAVAVTRLVTTGMTQYGWPSDGPRSPRRWLPEVLRSPSRRATTETPGTTPDFARLVSLLKNPDAALACWAFAALQGLPNDDLDGLLAHLRDAEPTRIDGLSFSSSSGWAGGGFRMCSVAAAILVQRMERDDLGGKVFGTVDPQSSAALFLELADEVQAAWEEFRRAPPTHPTRP